MSAARSSTGCWTCRVRKKKCSEERPACSTCGLLRIACHGYGEKPAWMDGGQKEKAEAGCIKRAIKENKSKKRRTQPSSSLRMAKQPRSLAEDSSVEPGSSQNKHQQAPVESPPTQTTRHSFIDSRSAFEAPASSWLPSSTHLDGPLAPRLSAAEMANSWTSQINQTHTGHTPPTPTCLGCGLTRLSDNYYGREATLLMHYLDEVFPLQFRFYNPLVSEGGRGWLLSILLSTKPLFHAALSLSAYHQSSILPLHSSTEGNSSILEDLERHYSLALVELKHHIDGLSLAIGLGRMTTRVEILACMIQLVSFEVGDMALLNGAAD
jgi:C6 transcription factor Pro1